MSRVAEISDEGRELYDAVRARLPGEYWRGLPVEVIRLGNGETVIGLGREDLDTRLLFMWDRRSGEPQLTAGRRSADGSAEFGGVQEDGTIRWGSAVVGRASFN